MDFLLSSLLLLTNLSFFGCQKIIDVGGFIKFTTPPLPHDIVDGSWLTVTLEDASQQDTRSVELGKFQMEIKGFNTGSPLKYQIKDAKLPKDFSGILGPSVSCDPIPRSAWRCNTYKFHEESIW